MQLLNDKNEDEDESKKQNELLQQLLKEENIRPITEVIYCKKKTNNKNN